MQTQRTMLQMKKQGKNPQEQINEEAIDPFNLPETISE